MGVLRGENFYERNIERSEGRVQWETGGADILGIGHYVRAFVLVTNEDFEANENRDSFWSVSTNFLQKGSIKQIKEDSRISQLGEFVEVLIKPTETLGFVNLHGDNIPNILIELSLQNIFDSEYENNIPSSNFEKCLNRYKLIQPFILKNTIAEPDPSNSQFFAPIFLQLPNSGILVFSRISSNEVNEWNSRIRACSNIRDFSGGIKNKIVNRHFLFDHVFNFTKDNRGRNQVFIYQYDKFDRVIRVTTLDASESIESARLYNCAVKASDIRSGTVKYGMRVENNKTPVNQDFDYIIGEFNESEFNDNEFNTPIGFEADPPSFPDYRNLTTQVEVDRRCFDKYFHVHFIDQDGFIQVFTFFNYSEGRRVEDRETVFANNDLRQRPSLQRSENTIRVSANFTQKEADFMRGLVDSPDVKFKKNNSDDLQPCEVITSNFDYNEWQQGEEITFEFITKRNRSFL